MHTSVKGVDSLDILQQLIPVEVPWQVSPSTPCLRLMADEVAENGSAEVQFVAHFGLEDLQCDPAKTQREVIVVEDPGRYSKIQEPSLDSPYRLVRIRFRNGLWARISPSYSDSEVLQEAVYDWRGVSGRYTGGAAEDWLHVFKKTWLDTSVCPDPGMYVVENSRWLRDIEKQRGPRRELRHYIILGHDAYIEVLAESWEWAVEHALEGW
ncbi:MAG: hypothetical protein GY847_09520 [Proteobacteria bacterium]|nr:hypothetical protein [Pseudomonadota bacterium]